MGLPEGRQGDAGSHSSVTGSPAVSGNGEPVPSGEGADVGAHPTPFFS